MKIAITGGSGFLGRHLAEILEKSEYDYSILSRSNKDGFIATDYSYESLLEVLDGFDAVIHLAATRAPKFDINNYTNDIIITQNLFNAAKDNGIKNIVNMSSISVYSELDNIPWNEDQAADPVSIYGVSKLTNEKIANLFNNKFDMRIKNLRMAHIFGGKEKNNYMINLFFRKAINAEILELNTSSTAVREFIYVKDSALACINAVQMQDKAGTFNVGSSIRLNNYQVAEEINKVFNNDGNLLVKNPDMEDTSKSSYFDSTLFNDTFSFENKYNFEQALEEIYEQYKEMEYVPVFY